MAESRIERAARECEAEGHEPWPGDLCQGHVVELIMEAALVADASSGIGTAGDAIRRHFGLAPDGKE